MTIRYGIIGTGMMGCEHIRNLFVIDGVTITAIADPVEQSRSRARKVCGTRFTPTMYSNYEQLLGRDDIDAIVVASPNYTHIDVMRRVFQTKKHVMLEKPMCTTISDSKELVASAKLHPGIVWIGLEYRYMSPIAAMLRELNGIGKIHMCVIREHRFPFLKKVNDWNRFNRNTGGTLVEKCCHFFDLMTQVIPSDPVLVFASGGQDVNHLDELYNGEVPDIIDNAFVIVEFANGARAMLDLCMFAEGSRHEQQITVTGDVGKIETTVPGDQLILSNRTDNNFKSIQIKPDPRVKEEGLHHGASYLEHLGFLNAIRNGTPPLVTARDGLMSVVLGVAAQQSIEFARPIKVNELV